MKVLKSFFLVLVFTILGYSAMEAGARDLVADTELADARICCNVQVDCPTNRTCTPITPVCSDPKIHICVKNKVAVEDEPAIP